MGSSVWVGERLEACRKLYFDGFSASQIARELGESTTRNGVIGVIHRQKWNKDPDAPRPSAKMYGHGVKKPRVRSKPKPKGTVMGMPSIFETVEVKPVIPVLAADGSDIPVEQRCSLFELTANKCKFPYGDPGTEGFFFCGGKSLDSISYCGSHAILCFQPAYRRR